MELIFTLIMASILAFPPSSSDSCTMDDCYDRYVKEGIIFFNSKKYDKAEESFLKANGCPNRSAGLKEADNYLARIKSIRGEICYKNRLEEGKKLYIQRNYAEAKIKFLEANQCENRPKNSTEADAYLGDLEKFLEPKDGDPKLKSDPEPAPPISIPVQQQEPPKVRPIETLQQDLAKLIRDSLNNLEKSVWDSIERCRTVFAYAVFAQKFPNSPNAAKAKEQVRSLQMNKPAEPFTQLIKQQKKVQIGPPVNADNDDRPTVDIPEQYIGKCEVTNKEFCFFLNEMGEKSPGGELFINLEGSKLGQLCRIRRDQFRYKYYVESGFEDYPVIFVTWYGADAYCKWLNTKYDKGYHLPSVSVLDYIAQIPDVYFQDNKKLSDLAPFVNSKENKAEDREPGIAKCGDFKANRLGLFHVLGNVAEWCADDWMEDVKTIPSNGSAYAGGDHKTKTVKGGAWNQPLYNCYFNNRNAAAAGESFAFVGFRLASFK